MHAVVADETQALGLISNVAGALGVWALVALFTRIDATWPRSWAVVAALATVTCPLYWLTAARPLSDVPGLAAALAVQALLLAVSSAGGIIAASFLAALAVGIRSQVAWLTLPLLLLVVFRHRAPSPTKVLSGAAAAFAAGCAVWAVPLVVATGGPAAYWRALFAQGAEDLTGIEMLWTAPTPRELLRALYFAFVAPWADWPLALPVLLFAAAGVPAVYRSARSSFWVLVLAFGPYLVFDIVFQETFTSRYALPLVPPIAYFAVRAVTALPRSSRHDRGGRDDGSGGHRSSALSTREYAAMAAPAFRVLRDMRRRRGSRRGLPVLAMHRREDLDLRRPMQWLGADMPAFSRRLDAPPKHEWLELVKYWNADGRAPIWFVADPRRTDLALIDRSADRPRAYRWPLAHPVLIGGVRPNEMDWYVFDSPGWYLGEGWALTPETAGVAQEDHRGPGWRPSWDGFGAGREAGDGDDWRPESGHERCARQCSGQHRRPARSNNCRCRPGSFFDFCRCRKARSRTPAGTRASPLPPAMPGPAAVVVEQFDAQSARGVFGFGDGWHEMEYNPATGESWRWISERGVIRARAGHRALTLRVEGETESFWRATNVSVRVGERAIARWTVRNQFAVQAQIPADVLANDETAIVIESDRFFVPAERSRRTQDRRHLALRVDRGALTPVF